MAEIALKSGRTGGPISAEVSLNAQGAGPGFATHICDVEVDPETGHVKILRYTAVQDVGRAIHPSYVEGQIQGGVTQGVGWALNEEYIYDKDGRMENPGFLDYRCPVASDMPMIEAVMVEVPNPRHPFGAKGVGEVPIVPPMAAVANAIADADRGPAARSADVAAAAARRARREGAGAQGGGVVAECHCHERSDGSDPERACGQARDCVAALAMTCAINYLACLRGAN